MREGYKVIFSIQNWDREEVVDEEVWCLEQQLEHLHIRVVATKAAAAAAPHINTAASSVKSKPSRQYHTPPITCRIQGTV